MYQDRHHAGRVLAERLATLAGEDALVVGLGPGGLPVAEEVARALGAPLEVMVVRKLGDLDRPEPALGALAEGGFRFVDEERRSQLEVSDIVLGAVTLEAAREIERDVFVYRRGRPTLPVEGHTVILVDDGLASGLSARAAIGALRARGAGRIVLAVAVAPPAALAEIAPIADEVVCPEAPSWFFAVGQFYEDFEPVTDAEVVRLLEVAAIRKGPVTTRRSE